MKRILLSLLMLLSISIIAAPPGVGTSSSSSPEFDVNKSSNISESGNILDEMDALLASKGWQSGENTKKGSSFFIALGTGTIQAPRNSKGYINSRINAFEKALLAAKKQMVEYIGTEVSKATVSLYIEPADINKEKPQPKALKDRGLFEKAQMLLSAKLDKALKAEGVEDPKQATPVQIKKVISSESFAATTKTMATSLVSGMQVYKTFEVTPPNKKGQVGVICIYSEKLQQMAESLVTGRTIPAQAPKRPIVEQIPNNKDVLLSSYGVQQKIDQNGKLVIIAYGQGSTSSKSPRAETAAYSKAKIAAIGLIRQFAGETVATSSDLSNAETTEEYDNNTSNYQDQSAFNEKIISVAKSMKISGIQVIKRWSTKHPLNGQTVCGVVVAWSPESANRANALGEKLNSPPSSQGATDNNTTSNIDQSSSYSSGGAEASDDAF